MMEDFMDDYVRSGPEKSTGMVAEDVIGVEMVDEVEATPFLPDGTEAIIMEPDILELDPGYKSARVQQQDNRMITTLQNDINDNRILIQELKSSINLLKASTSRIERDGRDLSCSISQSNVENNRLNNSLVDLEFRFNELVTRQEEAEADNNDQTDVLEACRGIVRNEIQNVIDKVEEKIGKLDKNIANIAKVLEEQPNKEKSRPPSQLPPVNADFNAVLSKVDNCIARTDLNDKSIATAWVGLIASLFLIPLAFFLGKFLSI